MIHFIIPLFNKSTVLVDNLKHIDNFLKTHLIEKYEIILCDDGSTDDTLTVAQEYANSKPYFKVIGYEQNKGRGHAIKFAGRICEDGYIIYMDLDFPKTTRLDRLIEMIKYLQDKDIVIGSRFLPDSEVKRVPLRAFVSKVYRWLVRLILPELKVSDIDVGFKGFRRVCFEEINNFSKIDGWAWDLEVFTIARWKGMKIKEFPIDWNEKYDNYDTSVNIFKSSIEEFCGILNMRIRSLRKI